MKKGFYTIMSAQFFSSLADNGLFVAAVELLKTGGSPEWQRAALVPMFALFYVVLAPFVGAFADAIPKGRVMFISNAIKIVGCLMMLAGGHPLLAYGIVGLGAAAYSPAKYGILTEMLPPSQLVLANGWIEGLTILSIILGVLMGGQLVGHPVSHVLLSFDMPFIDTGVHTPVQAALCVLVVLYLIAAAFNLRIPLTEAPLQPVAHGPIALLREFSNCNARLWNDPLGQISLATTTIFWGASNNLKYVVLGWAAMALHYDITQATNLLGVVAIGTAAGAVLASFVTRLDRATSVIPLGIAMGIVVIGMDGIRHAWVAAPFFVLLGGLGGFLAVPMNALLQHRGHNLMGAGRSIAVQNFNENAAILGLGALYTGMARWGLNPYGAIGIFGLVIAGSMWAIGRWHQRNLRERGPEVRRLLAIAASDRH
jgi:MFS family permease